MSSTRTLGSRAAQAIATVAVGAAAGATTYVLIPPASAGVEATKAPTSLAAAAADKGKDEDGPGCGPFGGWGSGDMPGWVEDRLDDLPADLRADLEAAWKIADRSDRRDALREIWQAAKDGEYGAEVQSMVEDGPFGGGWGPGRGGWGPGGHRGPWGR